MILYEIAMKQLDTPIGQKVLVATLAHREAAAKTGDTSSITSLNHQVIDEAEGLISIGEAVATPLVAKCLTSTIAIGSSCSQRSSFVSIVGRVDLEKN